MKKRTINSLYIHIPFCNSICPYCDFTKFLVNDNWIKKYLDELYKDIVNVSINYKKFKTIYIGGGTPSILTCNQLSKLLNRLSKMHVLNYEFTIEFNIEDITEEKIKLIKKYGINRISIGVQTFNKKILKEINRPYVYDYLEKINIVKRYIKNISVDLIYGFENQTLDDLKDDLKKIIDLKINHISIYSLIVDKGSIFYVKGKKEQEEEESRLFYNTILNELRNNGYTRYEISNFSKKKKYQSKHNLNYRNNDEYLALGVSSSGFIKPFRYKNSNMLLNYLSGERDYKVELVDEKTEYESFLLTNLRKENGFSLKEFKKIFKYDFYNLNKKTIDDLINNGLAKIKHNMFLLTDQGLLILDFILLKFF